MIPYIEYQGTRYEFVANFRLKKEYDKDLKRIVWKNRELINSQEILELQKFYNEHPNITDETLKENPELLNKLSKYDSIINNDELNTLQERYCFKMLNIKYGTTEETWEKMQEEFVDNYGMENLDLMFSKVIDLVFTLKVENNQMKKPLPEFMM